LCFENENLQTTINNLREENGSLLNKIHINEDEIDNKNTEIISWKQIVDKLGKENNELKLQIENIEEKNKKLVEALNLNIYNKATEYKERTVRQLRLSNSPKRIHKILSSRKQLPYSKLSPERLEGIIKEDIKTTDNGQIIINEIKPKTQAPPPFKLYHEEISPLPINQNGLQNHNETYKIENKANLNFENDNFVQSNYDIVEQLSEKKSRIVANKNEDAEIALKYSTHQDLKIEKEINQNSKYPDPLAINEIEKSAERLKNILNIKPKDEEIKSTKIVLTSSRENLVKAQSIEKDNLSSKNSIKSPAILNSVI